MSVLSNLKKWPPRRWFLVSLLLLVVLGTVILKWSDIVATTTAGKQQEQQQEQQHCAAIRQPYTPQTSANGRDPAVREFMQRFINHTNMGGTTCAQIVKAWNQAKKEVHLSDYSIHHLETALIGSEAGRDCFSNACFGSAVVSDQSSSCGGGDAAAEQSRFCSNLRELIAWWIEEGQHENSK